MTSDLDIFRSAQAIIKRHGDGATMHTAQRADEMLAAGDIEGQAIWKRIFRAVKELLARDRPKEQPVH